MDKQDPPRFGSHIQFRIHEPGKNASEKIELIQDAVREYKRRGSTGRIVSTTGHDVTDSALREFGHLRD